MLSIEASLIHWKLNQAETGFSELVGRLNSDSFSLLQKLPLSLLRTKLDKCYLEALSEEEISNRHALLRVLLRIKEQKPLMPPCLFWNKAYNKIIIVEGLEQVQAAFLLKEQTIPVLFPLSQGVAFTAFAQGNDQAIESK